MATRRCPTFRCVLISVCLLATAVTPPAPAAGAAEDVGTHVVRPGETLEGIAAFYLGDSQRWGEIWRLNQERIHDPNLILPGEVLLLRVPEPLPREAAKVVKRRRQVEEERHPREAEEAKVNDLLRPLDVVRTYEAASAQIQFGNHTNLVVSEQSRLVLGAEDRAAPVERRKIEIVEGQADLDSRPPAGSAVPVEIVMGGAVVAPRPSPEAKRVATRTRRPGGRGAQLMVYAGRSDIEAAGQRFEVARGMGTTVAEGGPPAPPEKLLDPPRPVRPEAGARLAAADAEFVWQAVEGAVSYTLEICHDAECGELERRRAGLRTTQWRGEPLPAGRLFWRVTATGRSGLDGFPGAATEIDVGAERIAGPTDEAPPNAAVSFSGPMVGVDDRLVLGVGAAIRAEVSDAGSGVAEWTRLLDGAPVAEAGWASPWTPGAHQASVTAVDRAGNRMTLEPAAFVYDPEPPAIRWGSEDGGELGRWSGPAADEIDPLRESSRPSLWSRTSGADRSPLVWTSSKVRWLPMTFGEWTISSDKPYIVIRARKRPVTLSSLGITLTRDRGLWIHATDPGCGVEHMRYQLFLGPEKRKVLVIEAVDALANESRVAWPLER